MIKVPQNSAQPYSSELVSLFNQCFQKEFRTLLVGGGAEPVYLPAIAGEPWHRVVFTQDYFSSALHEVAHWCLAGQSRREQIDYGYWYAPDGRSSAQQVEFERVEVKPQALEWLFAEAAGVSFRVSADNLQAGLGASEAFCAQVARQAQGFCREGVNARAQRFINALAAHFLTDLPLTAARFQLAKLNC